MPDERPCFTSTRSTVSASSHGSRNTGFVRNFEYRLRRKDGAQIVALENSRAIFDKEGNVIAQEGTITDITERKRAETRVFEEKGTRTGNAAVDR